MITPIKKAEILLEKIRHEIHLLKKLIYHGSDTEEEKWIDRLNLLESREGKINDFIHSKISETHSKTSILEELIDEFKNRCDTSPGIEQIICYQNVVSHLMSLLPRERDLQRTIASEAWDSCLRSIHEDPFSDPNIYKLAYIDSFLPRYRKDDLRSLYH